jgi:hypothetical protein
MLSSLPCLGLAVANAEGRRSNGRIGFHASNGRAG